MKRDKVTFNNKDYELDSHGFLKIADKWDQDFAEGIAKELGIYEGLTEEHWKIIRYLRKKFLEENTVPLIVKACADNKLRLNELRTLFPTGYHRGACKIAGINYEFMCDTDMWLTYESTLSKEPEFKVDEQGFLQDFEKWNVRFAHGIAHQWDLTEGLTEKHWEIIRYLRDFYQHRKNIPTIYEVCKANNIALGEIGILFPGGYRRGACRAAGLPFFA